MKKITLFLDKTFREDTHTWSTAYHAALLFYAELIRYISDTSTNVGTEIIRRMNQGKRPSHLKGIEFYIESFQNADRIEACVTLRNYKTLTLEVRAYEKGKKEPYTALEFLFASDGSESGYCGLKAPCGSSAPSDPPR